MRFDEYRQHDATALADLIDKGEVSAKDVLEVAIARADQVNPAINAIVHKQYERARASVAAGLPSGPLTGVPYLLKDLAFFDKGEPARLGSSLFKDFVADHDSAYVTRCKKAGLAIMGRSSTPEFGLNPNTEPRLQGSCRNPWNLEHSAGGSSGGAAAAVIAGILPVAHATDGGGSIRIPAAQCGLFGLKPSRGRMTLAPDAGEGWGGLSIGHVVSRSVRDSALMLDCTGGSEPGDPYAAPTPQRSFAEELVRPVKKLKIAMMLKDHRGGKLHPECAKAVSVAAKLCADVGHVVEEADAPLDLVALRPMNAAIAAAHIARGLGLRWKALRREPNPEDVEAATWAVYNRGLKVSGVEYVEAIATVHAAGRKLAAFLANWDVLLTTTLPAPPPMLGYFDQNGDVETFTKRVTEYLSITPLHNATGTPAMSVPLHWTADGLPIGVHFAGRYGEEATLLRLAAQLETAQPWFNRLPAL
jgi:Asp-tRNA(Asn)/Glu-tRNA(Gln) amidotransferase A subunit family amidase